MRRLSLLLAFAVFPTAADDTFDPPKRCDACDEWNRPQAPFRVFGDTYYVGVHGLSSILIANGRDAILLDGGLPQSAQLIAKSIESLGFDLEDVSVIANTHAHYDHAGGIAGLQRASGAEVVASAVGAGALERGQPSANDPQAGFGEDVNGFPAVVSVRTVEDGETVRVGKLSITAHLTPGHTPGSTTWSWRSCEGMRCLEVVYADSLNAVSAPEFRFTGGAGQPDMAASFERSIASVAVLPCDVLLSVHPDASGMLEKLEARAQQRGKNKDGDPFVDRGACRAYADAAARRLAARVAQERATSVSPVEAKSLDGRELRRPALADDARARFESALATALADQAREPSADHLIWVGRRLGYLGRYRESIERFSEGVAAYPRDARFLRHRGHRYLTTRQLDLAVRDFEAAAVLIAGTEDQIEPDGLPNARGIPTSTQHTNIYYHLGLAHYLRGDYAAAHQSWLKCLAASRNPDMEAATRYWLYLAQRRLGLDEDATKNLAAVDAGWDIIENHAYHRLLLRFRGDALASSSEAAGVESLDDATFAYGLAQWHRLEGRDAEADALIERLLAGPQWASFGYLAAEADRARKTPVAPEPRDP